MFMYVCIYVSLLMDNRSMFGLYFNTIKLTYLLTVHVMTNQKPGFLNNVYYVKKVSVNYMTKELKNMLYINP